MQDIFKKFILLFKRDTYLDKSEIYCSMHLKNDCIENSRYQLVPEIAKSDLFYQSLLSKLDLPFDKFEILLELNKKNSICCLISIEVIKSVETEMMGHLSNNRKRKFDSGKESKQSVVDDEKNIYYRLKTFDKKQLKLVKKANEFFFNGIKEGIELYKEDIVEKCSNKKKNVAVKVGKYNNKNNIKVKKKLKKAGIKFDDPNVKEKNDLGERECDSTATPINVVQLLETIFGVKFTFDPCPYKGKRNFDGLKNNQRWGLYNFVNPPYSNVKKWIYKALEEIEFGCICVFLIPLRSKCKYWIEKIWPNFKSIIFLPPVCFFGHKKPFTENMVAVLFERFKSSGCVEESFVKHKNENITSDSIYKIERY